jgi:uncharacterized Ntn-hydrolase superfamily protein
MCSHAKDIRPIAGSPFAHTYSIVAFDPEAKEMGGAVQSHWFAVGSVVLWAEGGVGVVATQSFTNPSFGPRGLEMLRKGMRPEEVVASLVDSDEGRDMRQLAVLDAQGQAAAHTGKRCVPATGHVVGEHFSAQANMMLKGSVWPAMAKAFRKTQAPLAERLLAALEAAEGQGGDIRGRQSACLLVVRSESTGNVWEDRVLDLRVDDSREPLAELRRLLRIRRAYDCMDKGDNALEKGLMEEAMQHYSAAEHMFPENEEMVYWHAVTLVNIGHLEEALPLFEKVFAVNENWREMTRRQVPIGLLKVDEAGLRRITRL